MKVAVLGASGQLGRDVAAAFAGQGHAVTSLTHEQVEVASLESVQSALESIRPDLVVNTAAYHHVEKCEANPELTFAVNGMGARNVAQVTDSLRATLIHISTDYVFDGTTRTHYTQDDPANPLNVYG